ASSLPSYYQSPQIGGEAFQDGTLTADPGSWSGTPELSYSYQWQRCDTAGDDCNDIPDAQGSTYTLVAADVGQTDRVVVSASNQAGSSDATSDPTPEVQPPSPPVPGDNAPSISGDTNDGQ